MASKSDTKVKRPLRAGNDDIKGHEQFLPNSYYLRGIRNNLDAVLHALALEFHKVAAWYGPTREDWRPAGAQQIAIILRQLEQIATHVLSEDGVPEFLRGRQVILNSGLRLSPA
jgi:hypothetical protein